MFFSSRRARIRSAHCSAGSVSFDFRKSRRAVSAAFFRTYVLVMLCVSSLSTSLERVSANSLPPTLQMELSARQTALSFREIRSTRIELMISRSSSSPSRSISAHHAYPTLFSEYFWEERRLTASMWPKSTSYPSMYMYRIFHTYFLRLYPFMLESDVNLERMCAISFSTRFSSCSLEEQLRRSEMKTVSPRIAMAAGRGGGLLRRVGSGRAEVGRRCAAGSAAKGYRRPRGGDGRPRRKGGGKRGEAAGGGGDWASAASRESVRRRYLERHSPRAANAERV
mmetsp:Transcript_34239/g.110370  ORF Transcript_34239/g.110370 Transcript_34239/m.110370 type:complete len:282 (+) Transcript_34239:1391-2236(+)